MIRYEIHGAELLIIIEVLDWRHYLEGCKYELVVLTDYNHLRQFMDTKSLSPQRSQSNSPYWPTPAFQASAFLALLPRVLHPLRFPRVLFAHRQVFSGLNHTQETMVKILIDW